MLKIRTICYKDICKGDWLIDIVLGTRQNYEQRGATTLGTMYSA
jgi:hypothetical protein